MIQLNNFLIVNGLLGRFQSGFRQHRSTETALIKVLDDIHRNPDSGKTSVLVLLDPTDWKNGWEYLAQSLVSSDHISKAMFFCRW